MPNINIISSDGRISNFPILKDVTNIGRSEDNDIVLTDHSVSRNHARIIKTKKGGLNFFILRGVKDEKNKKETA